MKYPSRVVDDVLWIEFFFLIHLVLRLTNESTKVVHFKHKLHHCMSLNVHMALIISIFGQTTCPTVIYSRIRQPSSLCNISI